MTATQPPYIDATGAEMRVGDRLRSLLSPDYCVWVERIDPDGVTVRFKSADAGPLDVDRFHYGFLLCEALWVIEERAS